MSSVNPGAEAEWEKVLNRLSQDNKRGSLVATTVSAIFAMSLVSGIIAFSAMLVNAAVLRAWPTITVFNPGIGYSDAFVISAATLVASMMFSAVLSAVKRGSL
ncbi:MAG: hypothetical protein VW907_07150 [Opitutae bacterium]